MKCEVCDVKSGPFGPVVPDWPYSRVCLACCNAIIELLNWRERVGLTDLSIVTKAAEAIVNNAVLQELVDDVRH